MNPELRVQIAAVLRALSRRRYELKMAAIIALARFDSDAALVALKTVTKVTAADFSGATTVKVAASLAANVRVAVAQSLASSKHKGAFELLWAMHTDPLRVRALDRAARPVEAFRGRSGDCSV